LCILLAAAAPPDIHTLSLHDALPISPTAAPAATAAPPLPLLLGLLAPVLGGRGLGGRLHARGLVGRGGDDRALLGLLPATPAQQDRKSTRLNSSHVKISYAVFCLQKK